MRVEMIRDVEVLDCVLPAGRVFDMPARLVRALLVEGAARLAAPEPGEPEDGEDL
ncbi:MAG: hypothetical protein HY521_14990 [Proteobacteria bacterium]|nr:hypothetical protein [Pseudomonadota bacterium]